MRAKTSHGWIAVLCLALLTLGSAVVGAQPSPPRSGDGQWRDRDDNPPGPQGGPGTNWENPPGPRGGPGTSPNRRRWSDSNKVPRSSDGRWWDRDDNPPGPQGGPGTNWENPPGRAGGPGTSPNR